MKLLIEFEGFQEEQALVGRMLMAYSEFEFEVAKLMGYALPRGNDAAARILFRVKGEGARLDVADAILRPFFDEFMLGAQWASTLGALRYCKTVRNQYAHCSWIKDPDRPLSFIKMDKDADSPDGTLIVHFFPTDLALLQTQHQYFEYALDWLWYLGCECRLRTGEEAPPLAVPKLIPQPQLHNLPKRHLPPTETRTTP